MHSMKIIIIGSVAAGTSVAAKARRNTEEAEIILYDKKISTSHILFVEFHMLLEEKLKNSMN